MTGGLSQPELSRVVKARSLPGEPVMVEANEGERTALARRFDLHSVEMLQAEIDLEQDGKAVRATGSLKAEIMQNCAISGEEFAVSIDEDVALRFVEQSAGEPALEDNDEIEIELDAEDLDEIEYSGDSFDLGEAIAQTLGLAIDPYAEGPGADEARKSAGITAEGEGDGPLAEMLRGLKGE